MMEINRKNFPGLYWLGRCFASFLAAVFPFALVGQYGQYWDLPHWPFSPKLAAIALFVAFAALWIAAVWMNVPRWIAWCLDALWRIVAAMLRDATKGIARAIRALVAVVRLVFWPVVAVFLVWKLCEWVWRIF